MIAVDPEKQTPAKVWDLDQGLASYVPCVLVKDDLLFWIGDKAGGQACLRRGEDGEGAVQRAGHDQGAVRVADHGREIRF